MHGFDVGEDVAVGEHDAFGSPVLPLEKATVTRASVATCPLLWSLCSSHEGSRKAARAVRIFCHDVIRPSRSSSITIPSICSSFALVKNIREVRMVRILHCSMGRLDSFFAGGEVEVHRGFACQQNRNIGQRSAYRRRKHDSHDGFFPGTVPSKPAGQNQAADERFSVGELLSGRVGHGEGKPIPFGNPNKSQVKQVPWISVGMRSGVFLNGIFLSHFLNHFLSHFLSHERLFGLLNRNKLFGLPTVTNIHPFASSGALRARIFS